VGPLAQQISQETDAEIRRRFLRLVDHCDLMRRGWTSHLVRGALGNDDGRPTLEEKFAEGSRDALTTVLRMAKDEI
jgi:hypothetical protein